MATASKPEPMPWTSPQLTVSSHPMSTDSKIVNLNKFRKAKARVDKRAQAEENSVKFGRTRAQKDLEAAQKAKAKAALDGHKTDDPK